MIDTALAITLIVLHSLYEMLLAGAVGWQVYKWQHNSSAGWAAFFALIFWELVQRRDPK